MDLTKVRDLDPNINQVMSRILIEAFERVGPAGQATTGTGGDVGKVTIEGLHANGVVLVSGAESIVKGVGSVVADDGFFTVYDGDTTTPAAIDGKLINYFVVDLGTAA
ncbi:hypothetical protein ES705_19850 [subsurface metagenome]